MTAIEDITIVLPAYNEGQELPPLLKRLHESLSGGRLRHRILIVDDGSKDRTAQIAREAARTMPLQLVQHGTNQGLGRAIQTGLTEASKHQGAIITMDADNSHDPKYIESMVEKLESDRLDVVIASRFVPGSQVKGVPLLRQFLSIGCFLSMKCTVPFRGVRDYSAGFRAYRASTLQRLVELHQNRLVEHAGFSCMLEVLLKLRAIGAKAGEVPYTLRYDQKIGASKLRLFRTLRQYAMVVGKHVGPQPKSKATMTGKQSPLSVPSMS
jgi:dolichol-phosphate mannosyltransferase